MNENEFLLRRSEFNPNGIDTYFLTKRIPGELPPEYLYYLFS